ncbi:MAG: phosphatase PAP2 family protein [Leptolyngbyaceae bacterium]|nr:phosphatase PAP2 family protein [Leptolyngbyaceae bacterium]
MTIGLSLGFTTPDVNAQNLKDLATNLPPIAVQGYLSSEQIPDSLVVLPPPPAEGSEAIALDQAINRQTLKLRGTPRWELAIADADLTFPHAAATFACAVNTPITPEHTPHLHTLLRRSLIDAGRSTGPAKHYYHRPRPFMVNDAPTCTPLAENDLRHNGSYPSGHTTIGWTWALILSEIFPAQGDAILQRGQAFGQSRMVCNVHWQSDVLAGWLMGAAVVARLHSEPDFLADMAAAKVEVAAVATRGWQPSPDCGAERAALAVGE